MRMRAVNYENYGEVDALQLSEVAIPTLADDELLIRVYTASLNPFDWKLRSGVLRDFFSLDFPIVPGRDGCGEVVALGEIAKQVVSDWIQPGQRVSFLSSRMQHGAFASFVAVKAQGFVAPAPPKMSDQQCAALPLVGLCAWNALVNTAELQPGMKALIQGGSGGVGSMAIQLARYLGAEVYATCNSANVGYVEELGATAIPYDTTDFTEAISDCDVVFDTVGGSTHERSYTVVKKGGRLVYLIARPFRDVSGEFDVETRRVIVGNQTNNLQQVMELAGKGILTPNVSDVLPMAEFRDAFRLVESGNASGKVILEIKGSQQ